MSHNHLCRNTNGGDVIGNIVDHRSPGGDDRALANADPVDNTGLNPQGLG